MTKISTKPAKTRSSTKKEKEEIAIPDEIISSDHIASSNENQTESVSVSFDSENFSLLEESLNSSISSTKSRPVPKIPGELLSGTPESKLKSPVRFITFLQYLSYFHKNVK